MLSLVYSMVWSYREKLLIGLRHFSHCTLRVVLSLSWSIAQPIKHFFKWNKFIKIESIPIVCPKLLFPSLSEFFFDTGPEIIKFSWIRSHTVTPNRTPFSKFTQISKGEILKVVLELKTFKKFLHFINEIFMFMKMKVKSCKQNYQIHFSIFHFIINYQFM